MARNACRALTSIDSAAVSDILDACAICRTDVERTMRPLAGYFVVLCLGLLLVAAVPWITLVLPEAFNFAG